MSKKVLQSAFFEQYGTVLTRLGKLIVILSILLFWSLTLYRNYSHLKEYAGRVGLLQVLVALVILMGQVLVLSTAWVRALELVGAPTTWVNGASMWLRAGIARYVPGGIWDIVMRWWLSRGLPMPSRSVPAAAALELGIQVLAAGSVLVFMVLLFPSAEARVYIETAMVVLGLVLVMLLPQVFQRIVNSALRLFGHSPLQIRLTYTALLQLFVLYALSHFLHALAFVLIARGIVPIAWEHVPRMMGAVMAAWLVRLVFLFVPAGIGVREAVLLVLLGGTITSPVVITAAAVLRFVAIIRDFLAAGIGVLLPFQKHGVSAVRGGNTRRCEGDRQLHGKYG